MKRTIIFLCAVLLNLGILNSAGAALFIDDTYTTDKGHFSLEFCLDYYRDAEKEFDTEIGEDITKVSKEWDPSVYLSYGLANNWDVGITLPYQFLDDYEGKVDGFSDLVIESKYRFWEEGKIMPSYAFYLDLKTDLANEDKRLGTGRKDYTVNNIFTKNIGSNVFDLNLGYIFVGGKPDDIFFYSFDIARDLTQNLNLCAEVYGETVFKGDSDENILIAALSLSYQVNKIFSVELGYGAGISRDSPDYQISHKLIFSF